MKMRGIFLLAFTVMLSIVLTGCFQGEQSSEEIDPPPESEAVKGEAGETDSAENEKMDSGDTEEQAQTIQRELYLIDKNGMVAPQTIEIPLPESREVATQALEYLVKDGPINELLPNGFKAVLPAGTDILGLNLQEDGTVIVDVSKEFKEYQSEEELQILQAMTYTLTQFDQVQRVQLWINGEPQEEMPVSGTPIQDGYTRANGINIMPSASGDLINQDAITVYYPAVSSEQTYFVPVTQRVNADGDDVLQSVVDTVISGPSYESNLQHVFNMETALSSEPMLKDGILQLKFNQYILKDKNTGVISDEVMETLVRSLTEHQGVEAVQVSVEEIDQLTNENGEVYKEPVTKDMFVPKEKL
ncbi:Spore germination protein GerM [Lentibacillus sp. JNUCC-1]|uniref:GerMN domain-containing protein n=1 Tax=Lentibacillus sp. JNUCC-1 TaxID=2654513 RepID=UPI0012E965DB|nr:GerMN domain-containing protein [Lentibacillus sp. JNUCC-1]MUV39402.1 Spore germination protein GerM [Lentibacillus sp. JNUCC-1]